MAQPPAADPTPGLPVARVIVDSGMPHLDHPFDYAVPPELRASALEGARVRVPFAGRDLDGFVVGRRPAAEHPGRLAEIRRVVSPEPVLTGGLLALCRAVADRYAGSLGDVLRLAVPKRHAAAERALTDRELAGRQLADHPAAPAEPADGPALAPPEDPWAAYPAGAAFLRRLAAGQAPAAAWLAVPGRPAPLDWPAALAAAAAVAVAAGRGALIVVPDHRDVARVDAALTARLGRGRHVRLTADQGPQARYTAWLKVLRGHVPCVVGTRAAAFAPLSNLGLVAWWDDGDDLHEEPRAPYPHVREILAIRAQTEGAALLSGGFARSVAVHQWVEAGRLQPIAAAGARAARVVIAGEGHGGARDSAAARARLPAQAWHVAERALRTGPVLVQVPRRGYLPALACQGCRAPVRCPRCLGPVALPAAASDPQCRWCATTFPANSMRCPVCDDTRLRARVVGAGRTAEELGRAFPGVPVLTSGGGHVLERVDDRPALVVATAGAEPVADGGYTATLLLDAWALLDRADLDAQVEALRRWLSAAALVRLDPQGTVVLAGVPDGPTLPAVEALARWDPVWLAERELRERRELALPPASVMARIVGERRAVGQFVADVLAHVQAGPGAGTVTHFGPTAIDRAGTDGAGSPAPGAAGRSLRPPARSSPAPGLLPDPGLEQVQSVLRVPAAQAPALAEALRAARAVRSARKQPGVLGVRMHWPGS